MPQPPPPGQRPQAVVFDLDGLLFNTEDLYDVVSDQILSRRGKRFDANLKRMMMGRPGVISLQIMIDHHQLDATPAILQQECEEAFDEILEQQLEPMPGCVALLDRLQQHDVPLALATSSRRSFVDKVFGISGFAPRFLHILTSESVENGKPDPEVYLLAAQRLGVAPGAMAVFEDSENGCKAAVAAGAITIATPNRHTREHDFAGAALVADTLADPAIDNLLQLPPAG